MGKPHINLSKDVGEAYFKNGSLFTVEGATDSSRGLRRHSIFLDETRDADEDVVSEIGSPDLDSEDVINEDSDSDDVEDDDDSDEDDEEVSLSDDDDSDEDERVSFYPNSRLLITRTCEQAPIENSNTAKRHVTYYVNVWNVDFLPSLK